MFLTRYFTKTVFFFYHLANLRHNKKGCLKSVVQERYKKKEQ